MLSILFLLDIVMETERFNKLVEENEHWGYNVLGFSEDYKVG